MNKEEIIELVRKELKKTEGWHETENGRYYVFPAENIKIELLEVIA